MKDSVLFEHVLAELLHCRCEEIDERDQREEILRCVVQVQLELEDADKRNGSLHDVAVTRINKLELIKQEARNLLGAADDATWKRCKERLIAAIDADQ